MARMRYIFKVTGEFANELFTNNINGPYLGEDRSQEAERKARTQHSGSQKQLKLS